MITSKHFIKIMEVVKRLLIPQIGYFTHSFVVWALISCHSLLISLQSRAAVAVDNFRDFSFCLFFIFK